MNLLPNNNPNLVGVDNDDSFVPVTGWLASGHSRTHLGCAVTGHPVAVVLDLTTGRVFSHHRSWSSLLHYRDDTNG